MLKITALSKIQKNNTIYIVFWHVGPQYDFPTFFGVFVPIYPFFTCLKFCKVIFYNENGKIIQPLLKGRDWKPEASCYFVNELLVEHSHNYFFFLTCCLQLLLCHKETDWVLTIENTELQSLKYLLSRPLKKRKANSASGQWFQKRSR